MKSKYPQVSIIIPTLNSAGIIKECLESIKSQTYPNIEIVIIDAYSTDNTREIACKYGKVFLYKLNSSMVWGTPNQQNFGATQAKGKYLYFVDSDMVLPYDAIESYVQKIESENAESLIVPEISYGEGFWAKCKILERSSYLLGDDSIEAPRFHRKSVWETLGGLDAKLGGLYDWDIHHRLKEKGYKVVRSDNPIHHNEGKLSLKWLIKKKYTYGKSFEHYFKKYRKNKQLYTNQFNVLRPIYFKNWKQFIKDPIHAVGFVIMKIVESSAFFSGFIVSKIKGPI